MKAKILYAEPKPYSFKNQQGQEIKGVTYTLDLNYYDEKLNATRVKKIKAKEKDYNAFTSGMSLKDVQQAEWEIMTYFNKTDSGTSEVLQYMTRTK